MPSDLNYRVAFWLDVELARQTFYADATKTSAVKGISAADLAALQSGAVVEIVAVISAPAHAAFSTVQQAARKRLADLQRDFKRDNTYNRYGTKWTAASGWVDEVVG